MIVKICGITSAEDAAVSIDAGAHALGFNFFSRSPRYIRPVVAATIGTFGQVLRVGVFVHEPVEEILRIMEVAELDVAQIHHGDLPHGVRTWRARNVDNTFTATELDEAGPEAFLLDAPAPGVYGGTGQVFDWSRISSLPPSFESDRRTPKIVLAGGLDASNVASAIRTARPWGVDACSKLESAPGKKDHQKVRDFVRSALSVRLSLNTSS